MAKTSISLVNGSSFIRMTPDLSRKEVVDNLVPILENGESTLVFEGINDTTIIPKAQINTIVVTETK